MFCSSQKFLKATQAFLILSAPMLLEKRKHPFLVNKFEKMIPSNKRNNLAITILFFILMPQIWSKSIIIIAYFSFFERFEPISIIGSRCQGHHCASVFAFWIVPWAATLQLMNMGINHFEVYSWLITIKQQQIHKEKPKQIVNRRGKDIKKKNRKGRTFKQQQKQRSSLKEGAYRALVRSLRSLSESAKKSETTSTTKSGLLSSWSCWSCKNWLSKTPFSRQEQKQQNTTHQNHQQKQKQGIQKEPKRTKKNPCCYTSMNKDFVYSRSLVCIWPTSMSLLFLFFPTQNTKNQ